MFVNDRCPSFRQEETVRSDRGAMHSQTLCEKDIVSVANVDCGRGWK